jgi:DNA-binding NarL/FixJ family response regulator
MGGGLPVPSPRPYRAGTSRVAAHVALILADIRMPIRILTVDDHPLLREGIAAVIEGQSDMQLVGEAANGLEALQVFRDCRPDVTLMDLQMPEMDGVDAIGAIHREFPEARIVVLTTYQGDAQALRAFKAGASGYLLKSMLRRELVDTIRSVHAGRRRIPPEIATGIAEHASDDALTLREIEVLRRVADGNGNKRIAHHLGIAEETVKAHMKNILAKLGANDRTHAVTIAVRRGIFHL